MLLGFLSILDRLSIRKNAEKSSEEIFSKGICILSQNSWITTSSWLPCSSACSNFSLTSSSVGCGSAVVYIARRFENTGVNIEDLISIGTIGLIKAVGTFKSDRNIKLATYASRCIENEILMHIRKIAGQKAEVSLDEPINTDWDGNELLLSDVLGTDGDIVMRPMEEDAEQQLLREALARLPERERRIVSLRFGLGGRPEKTQKEVADLLGISQSYISRLEKRIMQRLRRDLLRQVS